jgi:zinc transport system substrate-binding protein
MAMNIKRVIALSGFGILVAAAVFLAVSGNKQEATSNKVTVTASFYPLYDFAKNIGGDRISVANMTPPGSEPHDFEPAPKDIVRAQESDVFIYDGGTLEPWANKFLQDYRHIAVKASKNIQLQNGTGQEGETVKDPHFWLDPILAQQIVRNIRDGLAQADPANKSFYTRNANSYIAKLQKLDADYKAGLADCSQNTVIVSHEVFGYVAQQYHFTAEAITGMSPDQEPSSAKMAELASLAKAKGIKYVFFESLVSPRLADTIAQEAGARAIVFDPLEGLTDTAQKQGKNYISVQYENLAALRRALDCQ